MVKHEFDLTKPLMIHVNTSVLDGGVIETTIDMIGQITRRVLRTQEAQIREALVSLGWTPPATKVAEEGLEPLRDTSPGLTEADDVPPAGRPVRAVVELPPGACTEKELAGRLKDILRYPIKVYGVGGYRKYVPQFKSFCRVMQAERRRG